VEETKIILENYKQLVQENKELTLRLETCKNEPQE